MILSFDLDGRGVDLCSKVEYNGINANQILGVT